MGGGASKKKNVPEVVAIPVNEVQGREETVEKREEKAPETEEATVEERNHGVVQEESKEEKNVREDDRAENKMTEDQATLALSMGKASNELARFREKKKGFAGFRAVNVQPASAESAATNLVITGGRGHRSEEDVKRAYKILAECPLFDASMLAEIVAGMSDATALAGGVIVAQGESCPHFILLIEGEMTLHGKPVRMANESALLGSSPCQENLVATQNCRLLVITRLQYQNVTMQVLQQRMEKGGSLLQNITEIPGLRELPRETREAIALALKPVTFKAGEYLMKQGEVGNCMYFIEEGKIVIKQTPPGSREPPVFEADGTLNMTGVVAKRTRGEYIGEGALLEEDASITPRSPANDDSKNKGLRNASAIAASPEVRCLELGRFEFQAYLGSLRELFEHNLCLRVLKSLDLTQGLDDDQIGTLASALEEVVFEDGEYIVHQGELGDIFYIVKEGTLECTMTEQGAAEPKRVGTLIAGDYFGEGALLTNAPRRCSVVATCKTKCWGLSRSNFEGSLSDGLKQKLGSTFTARKNATKKDQSDEETCRVASLAQWEDFQKIRTLGSGSYGTVDLVRNKLTGETYARKRIRKVTVVAKNQQRFVRNERMLLVALSKFNSPVIVNLIRTFNKGDSVFMLMEVCLGGELYSLMKDAVDLRNQECENEDSFSGCFDLNVQCRFYTANIVLSIEFLHNFGVVHRDIKPENLLVDEQGFLKLADFGFAKQNNDQRTYSLCGTPEYTAPEVYKRSGHSYGVDWWSLGVILYEMSSGFSPFHVVSHNSWDCYVEIAKYEKFYPNIQFPLAFDERLCDFLLRLMNPNPAKRYGTRKANAAHIKLHPWFQETAENDPPIDWEAIATRTLVLPEVVKVKQVKSGMDAGNFDDCGDRHEQDEKLLSDEALENIGDGWADDF